MLPMGAGMGRSKLRTPATEKGTARNINTIAKLVELAAAAEVRSSRRQSSRISAAPNVLGCQRKTLDRISEWFRGNIMLSFIRAGMPNSAGSTNSPDPILRAAPDETHVVKQGRCSVAFASARITHRKPTP